MEAKKPAAEHGGPSQPEHVNTGGGVYIGGSVTAGRDFAGRDQVNYNFSGGGMDEQFHKLEQAIEARPATSPEDKADLHAAVNDIRVEAAKGSQANESLIERQLRMIGRMAPDILEVAVATFANPGVGLALVAKKIVDQAQPHDAK